jgi:hypothetical protein
MTLYTLFLGFLLLLHAVSAALPQVDYNRMGKVGLVGAFAGLDISDKSAASFDPTTATLLLRDRIGGLSRLGSTNPGGAITSGCALRDVYFFGGSFTSIGGISANNVASYSPSSATFAPLGSDGPNGQVSAMYCDEKESKVWVGGHFTSPGSSVALWDVTASAWSRAPFGGLAGAGAQVNSITANSSQSSIFFAGSFLTSFSGGPVVINGTNNPNIPFSAGATPFSSSLVPVPLQSAEVAGSPPSPDSQFSSIQAILCPSGPDGPGNTWLAEGGNTAVITARTFTFMNGHGIRLGNTFQSGHGTTGFRYVLRFHLFSPPCSCIFSVTTIPDNAVQRLNYLDPTTSQNRSCTDPCPLLSDPSIPYQDFLFDTPLFITGVQVKLSEYTGSGPGLHLFQILSSGAFASALDDQNGLSCFAPNPSNTTRTGGWSEKLANTNIPGTTQNVLVSTVDAGTPVSQAPSFTWIPYVSAAGEYDVNLLVPGCTNFQDCDRRTSVQVTVFPGQGLQPWVTTISQRNTEDASSLVYSGPIVPSSPDFVATVTMTLADGAGEAGSSFELVADRVQLLLKSANVSSSGATGGGPGAGSRIGSTGFGFFEWTRVATSVDATATLPNSTRTLSDNIGFELFQGARGLTSNTVLAVAHHGSGAVFIGGRFQLSSGSTNIAVYRNGNLAALSENGLNGPVTSLALDGDKLYVGGSFTDTGSGSAQGRLSRIASYDIQQSQWSALQAGVNGDVSSLAITNGQVQVAGNFTRLLGSIEGESDAAGFSAWDISSGSWVSTGGFVMGKLSLVGNGTKSGQGQSQFIAGNIAASLKYGGSGFVMLENGKDQPAIAPLAPRLAGDVAAGRSGSAASRRELARRGPAAWMPLITDIFSRQAVPPTTPLPAPLPAAAPAVLAGAFWTNSSTSKEVVIVGGNFSFASRGVKSQSVGIYDPESSRLTALQGPQVAGIVRALLVVDDSLYVGGQFTLEGTNVNGLAIYDLNNQQWDVSGLQPLQSRSASLKVIVAGSFSQAGALQCQSICSLDTGSKQWNALGNGVQGEVASVAYAGVRHRPPHHTCSYVILFYSMITKSLLRQAPWRCPGLQPQQMLCSSLSRTALGQQSVPVGSFLDPSPLSRSTMATQAAFLRLGSKSSCHSITCIPMMAR